MSEQIESLKRFLTVLSERRPDFFTTPFWDPPKENPDSPAKKSARLRAERGRCSGCESFECGTRCITQEWPRSGGVVMFARDRKRIQDHLHETIDTLITQRDEARALLRQIRAEAIRDGDPRSQVHNIARLTATTRGFESAS